MPTSSSELSALTEVRAEAALSRATPPPGTIPSSIAAFVAPTASLTLSLSSFNSTSVAAPTLMTATPPASLASLSSSFSRSKSEVVFLISALIWLTRPSICAFSPLPPTILVSSLEAQTRSALPQSSRVTESSFLPVSSEMTEPPVRMAISSSMAFLRSPKPGALTARRLKAPRSLLTTRVARASPSMSSAMMTKFLVTLIADSRKGRRSAMAEIFLSVMRMAGASITDSILAVSVTK